MKARWMALAGALLLACGDVAVRAQSDAPAAAISAQQFAEIVPGRSTKADVQAKLGAPWRIVQFNDCGMAMDDQADETWEYRGSDPAGSFRVHVEFGDNGVVHLIAKIPDASGGQPTIARVTPGEAGMAM